MDDALTARIKSAVMVWAERTFNTKDVVVGAATGDEAEDEEADRYLAVFAVRSVGHWLVAEVWVEDHEVLGVNDLGEGLPFDDVQWPWPKDEAF